MINVIPSFQHEKVAYQAYTEAGDGREALYRFYNEASGVHFYTASEGSPTFHAAKSLSALMTGLTGTTRMT